MYEKKVIIKIQMRIYRYVLLFTSPDLRTTLRESAYNSFTLSARVNVRFDRVSIFRYVPQYITI